MRLIVFDFDGTIFDSRRDLADSTNEMLACYGAAPRAIDDIALMIGDGAMDYRTYLIELARLGGEVPLMLEHLEGAEYAVARDRVFAVGKEVGVSF